MNYLLHVGVMFTIIKIVYQHIPTCENREHSGNFQNKSVRSAFNWVLPFSFLKWNRYFSACKRTFLESTSHFSFEFCINISSIKNNSPIPFLAQTLLTFIKSNLLKYKFLRFLSAWVKICQIHHVNFELTNQFLFRFSIILHCHDPKLPCKF